MINTCSNSLKYEHPTENQGFEIFVFWPQTTSNFATFAVLDLKPKMILQMDFFMLWVSNILFKPLLVLSQQWKHNNNLWKLFEVDRKYQKEVIDVVLVSLQLTLNIFHRLLQWFYCWYWTGKYWLERSIYINIAETVFDRTLVWVSEQNLHCLLLLLSVWFRLNKIKVRRHSSP